MNEILKEELTQAIGNLADVICRIQTDNIKAVLADFQPAEPHEEDTFTPQEAAAYLHCKREKVYRMIRGGEIPHHNVGSRIFIQKIHLDKWIESGGSKACAEG